jgi:hypothetical protein
MAAERVAMRFPWWVLAPRSSPSTISRAVVIDFMSLSILIVIVNALLYFVIFLQILCRIIAMKSILSNNYMTKTKYIIQKMIVLQQKR